MFTLPPRPPKDYKINDLPKLRRTAPDFCPELPTVTQTTIGKFCTPIEYLDEETPETSIKSVNDKILDKWTKDARAWWVDKPGQNDFYLHDIYKNYSLMVEPNYNPTYKAREKIFNRSFKYELECWEEKRLQKLRDKSKKEEEEFLNLCRIKTRKEKPVELVKTCVEKPPFWWKDLNKTTSNENMDSLYVNLPEISSTYSNSYVGWQSEPELTTSEKIDPCQRRNEMLMVGLPFRTEACNWYYNNYPSPNVQFRPKKFS